MSHRFLIDMNLSPAWVERLAQDGWLGVHWSSVGDPRATDVAVIEHARTNEFVVFTHDLDLTTILALTEASKPSALQVRTQDVTPDHIGPLVAAAIREHGAALDRGAIVTVDETTARVRILPLI